ncbi:MAG: 30S ribosomal protein S18 [Parcubacteria group bacterium]|nr:30S ribosomal protein S18 [Parcubacteria group bacterium]
MQQCFFCSQNVKEIDYKETDLLRRFISAQSKIIDPKHTGTCATHQRRLARSIKRARFMGLLPFTK